MDNILLLVIALGLVAVVALAIILAQYRHIRELTKPRYGFLGKPLYSLAVMVMMASSVGVVFYGSQSLPPGREFVGSEIDANQFFIDYSLISFDAEEYNVQLKGIPVVQGSEWGFRDSRELDIRWKIVNTETSEVTEISESGLSATNQGGISVKLLRGGRYQVTATTNFLGQNKLAEIGINF